jgi:tagatose-1,6-bisphosphate aldolase
MSFGSRGLLAGRTIFRRAIEHGNLTLAELTIREIGVINLDEALELRAPIGVQGFAGQ